MSELSPAVSKPGHVPSEAVYDFDIFMDPSMLVDPHERMAELLRDAPPLFWTPRNNGHWVATGYHEVQNVSRDHETFSSEVVPRPFLEAFLSSLPADMPYVPRVRPISLDPPDHTLYRTPLNPFFSAKQMMARKAAIRALADTLIEAVIAEGHCDFIQAVAEPLPVQVFLEMMGLPLERSAEFRALVHMFLAPVDSTDVMDQIRRIRRIADAMAGEIAARREQPRDDLISLLWATEIDGDPMTIEIMEDFAVLLFIAGLDTVINGIGYGIRHLARNPDLQQRLREEPGSIVLATEELLRRYSFVVPMRRVTRDVEFAEQRMEAGERIALVYGAAGLDPRVFPNPEEIDIDRPKSTNLAFGAGPHRCLGSHLARVELQTVYEAVLARLPPFRLDPDLPIRFRGGNIMAIETLPIRWD